MVVQHSRTRHIKKDTGLERKDKDSKQGMPVRHTQESRPFFLQLIELESLRRITLAIAKQPHIAV